MKPIIRIGYVVACVFGMLTFSLMSVFAHTHFVSLAGGNILPYTSWITAATNIQNAIDASTNGDTVLVTNGVYASGGRVVYGAMTNRVAVTKPITVQSVNGPQVTVIQGYQVPGATNGDGAMRCVYLTNGAVLSGFTLTNGATRASAGDLYQEQGGGGVWCVSTNAMITNCTLVGNSAYWVGGGVYSGTLNNCMVTGNAVNGASLSTLNNCAITGNAGNGVNQSTLNNCTVTGNTGDGGGGAASCTLNNCIVFYNQGRNGANYGGNCVLNYCSTTPNPIGRGVGNIAAEPLLADNIHLAAGSPCVGAGSSSFVSGTDIDGEPWRTPPAIGSDEPCSGGATVALAVAIQADYTNVASGFALEFVANIVGHASYSIWSFGDGTVVSNRLSVTHVWSAPGAYVVKLSSFNNTLPGGVAATALVQVVTQPVYYVNRLNLAPVAPFLTWATAATNIQDAIAAVGAVGAMVLVTNGLYDTGAVALSGSLSNRIAIAKPVTVRSVNGPNVTIIKGAGPVGTNAVRCAYVGANATLDGFTLTNGCTLNPLIPSGYTEDQYTGGGAYCALGASLTNCNLTGNSARTGGGAAYGTLANCTLNGNIAQFPSPGGGAVYSTLINCMLSSNSAWAGGGVYNSTLTNCILTGNSAGSEGGGADLGTLNHCSITGNSAKNGGGESYANLYNCILTGNSSTYGGGAYGSSVFRSLNNCTLVGNTATISGGGAFNCVLNNCIVYYNTAPTNSNIDSSYSQFSYCCTTTAPTNGVSNITNPPVFLDPANGNYRLAPSSPCIDAGQNQAWMFSATDLDGNPRILNGTVDMGAYETPFALMLKACLQGPYSTNSHSMRAGNWTNTPLTSPYGSDPRTIAIIPSNIVDWVLVELRNTNGSVVEAKSAFLNTQGQLLGLDGSAGMTAEVSSGYYSVVLKQRNHVAIMSAQPVAFTNYAVSYDFLTEASQYAGGSNGALQLEPGVWGMIAGDADGNGVIQMVDGAICTNQLGQVGYNRADFNLDGVVNAADLALWQANMGLSTGMTNGGETALTWALNVSPIRKTVLSGATVTLTASGTSNAVNWAFVSNPSGATLTPQMANTALYTAGPGSNVVDILEAWDGNLLGRSWMNVISSADVARVGKAIVIAGQRSINDPVWPTTDYLGSLAYNTLLYRGFAKNNVQYLSPVTNEDVDGNGVLDDIAMTTTFTNAAMTFTNWAMNNPGQLFVYLVDHGGTTSDSGYFRLNPSEVLTPASLNQWLDAIQDRYGIDVVVVLDFCESGSFVQPLAHSGPGKRIVISACASNEPTYFVAGGQVSFSDAFFGGLLTGLDVAGAFDLAESAMSTYQSAQLDANGDGVYTPGTDTALVAGTYVGASFIAGKDVPQIGHVLGDQMLYGATTATLWAYDIASAYPLQRVWCFVVPPSHNPNPTNPVADLPSLDLTYNPATGRYEAQYSGFSEMGPYKLVYYAKDIWESVSQPKQSYVFQNGYQERVILAAGGNTNAAIWPAIDNLARLAYHTFLSRRLNAQAIYYLSPLVFEDIDGDGTNNVAGFSSLTNLSYAITNWATGANKLTVYLVGDGANGMFRLNPTESLMPADLKSWLDAYQASNGEAQVVMDFSGSGAFLPVLKAPLSLVRISVASSQAGKTSLFWNGEVMSFSAFFLNGLFNGDSIGQSYAWARDAIKLASGGVKQTALLDDNGDGVSSKTDGALAATHYIGSAFRTGADAPVIGTPMTNSTIAMNGSLMLWAQDVTAVAGISNVWCLVTSPDYDGTGDLPQVNLAWNVASSRYEVLYTNFIQSGTYACTFYTRDNSGQLSSAQQSTVTILGANLSPVAVSASFGTNGTFQVAYQGFAGNLYALEESTNLVNWVPRLTNQVPQSGILSFSITNQPATTRAFYRARVVQ